MIIADDTFLEQLRDATGDDLLKQYGVAVSGSPNGDTVSLLQISDLHIKLPITGQSAKEAFESIEERIRERIEILRSREGDSPEAPADGLIVSGDILDGAHIAQLATDDTLRATLYSDAYRDLLPQFTAWCMSVKGQILAETFTPDSACLVIPGNHDVLRSGLEVSSLPDDGVHNPYRCDPFYKDFAKEFLSRARRTIDGEKWNNQINAPRACIFYRKSGGVLVVVCNGSGCLDSFRGGIS